MTSGPGALLYANELKPPESQHIIEARQLWAADQQRRQTGKNAPGLGLFRTL
jgi:hypothetical protein